MKTSASFNETNRIMAFRFSIFHKALSALLLILLVSSVSVAGKKKTLKHALSQPISDTFTPSSLSSMPSSSTPVSNPLESQVEESSFMRDSKKRPHINLRASEKAEQVVKSDAQTQCLLSSERSGVLRKAHEAAVKEILYHLGESAEQMPNAQKEIALLWYPKTEFICWSHFKILVNGTVWSTWLSTKFDGLYSDVCESARHGSHGRGFVKFTLSTTAEEADAALATLKSELGTGQKYQTCLSGAGRIISDNTHIELPFFRRTVTPYYFAGYLALSHYSGQGPNGKSVRQINYIGPGFAKNLLAPELFFEVIQPMMLLKSLF